MRKDLDHPYGDEFYESLSPKRGPEIQGEIPCPRLTTLDMSVHHYDRWRLVKLLRDRAAGGFKLKTLRLLRSQIPQPDVELFRRFVDTLELLDEHERPRGTGLPEVCLEGVGNWWRPWGHDF